jgi:hypothetical protein
VIPFYTTRHPPRRGGHSDIRLFSSDSGGLNQSQNRPGYGLLIRHGLPRAHVIVKPFAPDRSNGRRFRHPGSWLSTARVLGSVDIVRPGFGLSPAQPNGALVHLSPKRENRWIWGAIRLPARLVQGGYSTQGADTAPSGVRYKARSSSVQKYSLVGFLGSFEDTITVEWS